MSKLLERMYENVEREEVNDKMKEFIDGLNEDEKKRLREMVDEKAGADEDEEYEAEEESEEDEEESEEE